MLQRSRHMPTNACDTGDSACTTACMSNKTRTSEILYDFVKGRVSFYTIVKRGSSIVGRDKFDTQRHAGGLVPALKRRRRRLPG